ncbi:MAG TPA: glycerophosphodiester phosphodiesterase family protein, partial [Xanthobacteraceae bacterium]|nr:glycerophosphodiester phosphodiesterase family protein [Xanthobacteraceae bacterium]
MSKLAWLTARPVAHRGLHDLAAGVIENMPAAVTAAIASGYAIEVDLQISSDGEAMVHHDDVLGRLSEGSGRLDAMTASELKRVPFRATADRMMTLGELLDLVGGRATLVLELKSLRDGDRLLPARVAQVLVGYSGPVAAMSFDPASVLALENLAPKIARGIVAQRARALADVRNGWRARPQFVAYSVKDLPAPAPLLGRYLLGKPLLTW